MGLRVFFVFVLSMGSVFAYACDSTGCTENATQCVGEQIQTCVGGVWEEAVDCPVGQTCHTMDDSGMQHCMAMQGDDDDSSGS